MNLVQLNPGDIVKPQPRSETIEVYLRAGPPASRRQLHIRCLERPAGRRRSRSQAAIGAVS
jgi:hypothetical protein